MSRPSVKLRQAVGSCIHLGGESYGWGMRLFYTPEEQLININPICILFHYTRVISMKTIS